MIWECQRLPSYYLGTHLDIRPFYIHTIEAPDEATARDVMYHLSMSRDWLDPERTAVWPEEDWVAR